MHKKIIGIVSGAALLTVLAGCVGYESRPRYEGGYAPPPDYIETGVVVRDDYVYYPSYQVYYSSYRHEYVYLDGRSWVSRPAPPHVSANVLFASPSVRLDFHDSPSLHHSSVVQQYPKHWTPPGQAKKGWGNARGDSWRGRP